MFLLSDNNKTIDFIDVVAEGKDVVADLEQAWRIAGSQRDIELLQRKREPSPRAFT